MIVDIMGKKFKAPKAPKRSHKDKYQNIKIPVNDSELKQIRYAAFHDGITVADYVEQLLRDAFERPYITELPEQSYEDTKRYANGWLKREEYDYLRELAIEWGVSIRKAAHRIMIHMMKGGDNV